MIASARCTRKSVLELIQTMFKVRSLGKRPQLQTLQLQTQLDRRTRISSASDSANVASRVESAVRTTSAALAAAALCCTLLHGSDAAAQSDTRAGQQAAGMDTHLFRPAVDSKGFVTVN